ncbi:aspartate aminotransferase family protein [Allopusillimonas soli]|uniref:Acetylornithine aminotransferase n=1 Tax=Allopusillimonas soli TaxID=659016 RepID=A0A853FA18_9BURK|nr:aspartate aminotransferase family protein [Allopusillimonas soli]NYT36462.1 aspartate aminotransferase family protein [Allopusillimonas soli]TEA74969.1 aspartate aminotransferase family protein [Allopusillimonas soli]
MTNVIHEPVESATAQFSSEALIPTHKRLPVTFTHGNGAWLWDTQGKKYLDALAGIAVNTLGHAHPALVKAVSEQAAQLIHISNNYFIPQQIRLAERLVSMSGLRQAFFVNSGAEANECAIKLARMLGHKRGISVPKILVMEKAFHGRTMGSLSATAKQSIREGFGPLLEGFERVRFDIEEIENASKDPDVVAVLLEVIQGEGGINLLPEDSLRRLRKLCDERDILLMLDEVQTGIARTGKLFAYQHANIVPDVLALAKGLGGGVPIGACLIGERAMDIFSVGSHGSTFGGNPLVCAAANAVLDVVEQERLYDNARVIGNFIAHEFQKKLVDVPGVRGVRGAGLLIGIELEQPCGSLPALALDAGLLISVTADNVVRLAPPLILSQSEAEYLVDTLVSVIRDYVTRTRS